MQGNQKWSQPVFVPYTSVHSGGRAQTRALFCTHACLGKDKFLYILAQYPILWNVKALHTLLP